MRTQHLRVVQGASGSQRTKLRVGWGVPQEISQAGGQGVVIQATRLLLEIEIGWRAKHGGIAGQHGLGESAARLHRSQDEGQKADFFLR